MSAIGNGYYYYYYYYYSRAMDEMAKASEKVAQVGGKLLEMYQQRTDGRVPVMRMSKPAFRTYFEKENKRARDDDGDGDGSASAGAGGSAGDGDGSEEET